MYMTLVHLLIKFSENCPSNVKNGFHPKISSVGKTSMTNSVLSEPVLFSRIQENIDQVKLCLQTLAFILLNHYARLSLRFTGQRKPQVHWREEQVTIEGRGAL